ncbi:MAG: beta-L-arabinofuranosidase domain-containing protein [Planctomycetota bacterium]|jgi:DUF1680 family protein
MNLTKSLAMVLAIGAILLAGTILISGCGSTTASESRAVAFSFEDTAVTLPSPASVKLGPDGRFDARFQGNINYLRYQHDYYGQDMLEAFVTRHYSPGKLLERVWDGEYAGKWLDASTRTAANTGDEAQLAMVDAFAASLRRHQQPSGYMGIELPTNRELNEWEVDWDLWCQWNALIGLLTHYELRGEHASLEAASRIGEWIVNTYGPIEDKSASFFQGEISGGFTRVVVIGQLVRLYRHIDNEDLPKFVGQVIQHYPPIQQMLSSGEPFLVHPYMLSAILGGLVEYAQVTQDSDMLAKAEQVWDGLVRDHLFPTGSLGETEDLYAGPLQDVPDGQLQETCATTQWIFFTQSLYALTGRAKYVEALEQTTYNALLAAQSADGMKWCYWTPLRYSKDWFHGPTRCCFWSGPKGIARLPQLIYAVKDDTIYVNFFETSSATLNTTGGQVHVTQQSQFPKTGASTITLRTPSDFKGTLRVRKPRWATEFQIKLNGKLVPKDCDLQGYCDINLEGSTEYHLDVQFDIPLVLEHLSEENYVFRRGPEVLAIDIRDNIDTWLGAEDDLITIPQNIALEEIKSYRKYQWPGPAGPSASRRRYGVSVNDDRTSELRSVILTPYADAGNEGAAFRTVFPLASEKE